MAKIVLITDTHHGYKNSSEHFANYFKRFYDNVFFPYVKEHNIKYLIHCGDIVDRRKYIAFQAAGRMRQDFIEPANALGLEQHYIIGNHDVPFRNTNAFNSMSEMYHNTKYNLKYYENATEIEIDGIPILLVPWINSENIESTFQLMDTTKAQILFGHLELQGFQMYRGSVNYDGLEANLFSKFDIVCTGHFHHKSTGGNINYLGAPYEMTWGDFKDPRGFHVFDTDTRELTFIPNPYRMFHKLYYNDLDKTLDEVLPENLDDIKDCVVKVIIINKTNPMFFEQYMDRIERIGVAELQIVEDHKNLDVSDGDVVAELEDTITVMNSYVNKLEITDKDKKNLDNLFRHLYQEVHNTESE